MCGFREQNKAGCPKRNSPNKQTNKPKNKPHRTDENDKRSLENLNMFTGH